MARPVDISLVGTALTEGRTRMKPVHRTLTWAIHDAPDPRIYFRLPYIPLTEGVVTFYLSDFDDRSRKFRRSRTPPPTTVS